VFPDGLLVKDGGGGGKLVFPDGLFPNGGGGGPEPRPGGLEPFDGPLLPGGNIGPPGAPDFRSCGIPPANNPPKPAGAPLPPPPDDFGLSSIGPLLSFVTVFFNFPARNFVISPKSADLSLASFFDNFGF